ncbi:hypothetical protein Hamer_G029143 [Homarus americanus]|uniref:Uncharacterized protein n=1 Tax=Homarus americanus TaxID=6706 RepID=A0A8J5JKZ4_HOMAM|nr:hypothetical protein Hamer_G029143 [Homarus americanus]
MKKIVLHLGKIAERILENYTRKLVDNDLKCDNITATKQPDGGVESTYNRLRIARNSIYTVLVEAVSTGLRMIWEHEFSGEVDYCLRCVVYCNQQTGILVSCGYPGSAAPWSCRRRTLLLPPSDHLCTVFLDAPMASADALLQPDYSAPVS